MTNPLRWFLPQTPDVMGMLQEQAARTAEGMDAFVSWARGDETSADRVRDAEHACDQVRRRLVDSVREAFTTPMAPEDLFAISQGLDKVMNGAKNTVRESEAMKFPADAATAQMAQLIDEGVRHLQQAFAFLDGKQDKSGTAATDAASAAVKCQRNLERVYRQAMFQLTEATELRTVIGSRELYRRLSAMSDDVVAVAERIWYARVKEA